MFLFWAVKKITPTDGGQAIILDMLCPCMRTMQWSVPNMMTTEPPTAVPFIFINTANPAGSKFLKSLLRMPVPVIILAVQSQWIKTISLLVLIMTTTAIQIRAVPIYLNAMETNGFRKQKFMPVTMRPVIILVVQFLYRVNGRSSAHHMMIIPILIREVFIFSDVMVRPGHNLQNSMPVTRLAVTILAVQSPFLAIMPLLVHIKMTTMAVPAVRPIFFTGMVPPGPNRQN
ncbi:MAG: hypothetical protein OMM_06089 [Candidatus Magnetoglobus multicellularis str. Araruama]|uniref:Uncharacterized protein n=1 Tax=Candidatus Magnetoglobus multicellularis str. Araruama TaxID=890399 RepID=A0A1V1NRV6_9BACT|nr:MAG: hypothetical protein OMM_06089 [Candidatus Magnetoglobus multicellularis str. Araruama]